MRYSVSCLTLLFLLSVPGWAVDEPKSNALTVQEIADGWLLLFDGETTFGWKIEGETRVEKGTLILGGTKASQATSTCEFNALAYNLRFDSSAQQANEANPPLLHILGRSIPLRGADGTISAKMHADERSPLRFEVPAGRTLQIRGLKVQPSGLKSIFNGKDLAGWKEFPGRKSTFSVTPEGWLNIKNGPGDLQTEGQYADFLLQLECISNGKHLNSGVFFRCRPNEYQQGYEAQIQNGFTTEPSKEYTIEEYDPKTNELKDKKKIKSTAIDYGTGAIYRRVPARKQMARDHEWFTMTVIAQGRHIATWVNGVQMVDWTDYRPLKDNARNGCRLEAGPISLQGHDPTTDLSFRNFRIGAFSTTGKK